MLAGSGRSLAQENCSPTLLAPAVDASLAFPQEFSWTLVGSCNAQLAFATNGILPDVAYVFATTASPTAVSEADWAAIREALDPLGTRDEYYWTLVDSDAISFLELTDWRRFYTRSQIKAITPTPPSGNSRMAGQNFTLHVDVNYNVLSSGALQVSITGADELGPQSNWAVLTQAGTGTKGFDFTLTSTAPTPRDYTITCQFRPGATTGPLAAIESSDSVASLSPFTVNWQRDSAAPSITMLVPTAGHTFSTGSAAINLSGHATDNLGVVEVAWTNDRGGNGVASGTDNWSIVSIPLQGGLNQLTVSARDAAGNKADWPLAVTYTPPDTTKPTLSISSPTTSNSYATANSTLSLAGAASDNVAVAQVLWTNDRGGNGTASGTSDWAVNGIALLSGLNNITVMARDAQGNEGSATLAVSYTPPDTTKPWLRIDSPSTIGTYDTTIGLLDLRGSAGDNTAVAQVRWTNDRGGSGIASGTSSWSINGTTLSSGVNNLIVTARDAAGNESSAILAVTYTPPDTIGPTVGITSPTTSISYATTSDTIDLSGTASDNVAVTQVIWNNDRGGTGTASGTAAWWIYGVPLSSGLNNLTVSARDAAGHESRTTLAVTYTLPDTTGPTLAIMSPTLLSSYATTSGALNLAGTASDNIAVTQVIWNNDRGGSGTATGTTSWSINGVTLLSGVNSVSVIARDAEGNENRVTLAVTYAPPDTTEPTISLGAPTTSSTYVTTVGVLSLAGTANDNVAVTRVIWSNDRGGSGAASGTSNWSIDGVTLLSGLNNISVAALDAVGNENAVTLAVTYNPLDTSKPTLSISSPTASSTYVTTIGALNLAGTASDNVAVTQVIWSSDRGGTGTASGTTSWSINAITLFSGLNHVTVTARDAVGNEYTEILAVTYNPPDTTRPTLNISSPTSRSSYSTTNSMLSLAGSASDDVSVTEVSWTNDRGGSGIASGGIIWSITDIALQAGLNRVTITARDASANSTAVTLLVTYNSPDSVKPTVTITTPSSAASYSTTVNVLGLAGSASDNVAVQQVAWSNDRGGSGLAAGTTSWSAPISLQPGLNTITVTAGDSAGNSSDATLAVTYNATGSAPRIAILSPTTLASFTTTTGLINLSGGASGSPALSRVTWANDRGGDGTASGTVSWSAKDIALRPGSNQITVTAWDTAGNSTAAIINVTFDASDALSPTLMITTPTSSGAYSTSAAILNVGGSASDNMAVTQITWNNDRGGDGIATGTTMWTCSVELQPGDNQITISARDAAGNVTSSRLSVLYTPDDRARPTISINSPTALSSYATTSGVVTLAGTVSSQVELTLVTWANDRGGAGTASGTTSWSIAEVALQPGLNKISVSAEDAEGNVESVILAVTYNSPDTISPSVRITTPTSSGTYSTTKNVVSLGGLASDNVGVLQVEWSNDRGGSGLADGTTNWSAAIGLQPGLNNLTVTARDKAGLAANSTLAINYTSGTAPVIAILSPTSQSNYATGAGTINLAGGASGSPALSRVTWENDQGGNGTASGTLSWSAKDIVLQPGANRITVTAWDSSGNSTAAAIVVNFNSSDTVNPTLMITSPSPSGIYSASEALLKVSGWASDNVAVTQISWNNDRAGKGAALGTATWTANIDLLPGSNEITLTARDAAGNQASARLSVVFTPSDQVHPTIVISSPTTLSSYSTTIGLLNLAGTAGDNAAVKEVNWSNDRGGSGTASGTTSWSINGVALQNGLNRITITARDTSGNATATPLAVTYNSPDSISPTVRITTPTASATFSSSVNVVGLAGSASDDLGVKQISWSNDRGGSGLADGTTSWSTAISLQPGLNNIAVTARDAVGNSGSAMLAITYNSGRAPIIAILSPTSQGTHTTASTTINLAGGASGTPALRRVTWANDRGGSGTASGTVSWSAQNIVLQPGANAITVTAWDTSGNSTTASLAVTCTASEPPVSDDPKLQYGMSGKALVFTWADPAYVLQGKSNLSDSIWIDVPGGSPLSIPMGSKHGFYRLNKRP